MTTDKTLDDTRPLTLKVSIERPPKPEWELRLQDNSELVFYVVDAPNKFHRIMQKLLLGFTWKRIDDERP